MSEAPRCSVVVPVYNEGANIAAFCREAAAKLPEGSEVLIVYDMDEDDTLPALAAVPAKDRPRHLHALRNTLGRGVRNAIVSGMRAAKAPVVVVTMADLSDDLALVESLVGLVEGGAAVACASRYMRGGAQHGGPFLKGLLSRLAGLSLHWVAGLPTHDPTNSFKAYRRAFLERTPVESPAGFCLALELTVKAHFAGEVVTEIPAQWWDRTAGTSRFRLLHWLPAYLRWYAWAFGQRLRGMPKRAARG